MSESAKKCTAESCACGGYRPRDDGDEECHCGCPWCDDAITDMTGLARFAAFCGDLAEGLRACQAITDVRMS